MYVVHKWDFTEIPMGSELAFVNLCKVGDGPLGKLIASYTKKKVAGEKPPFALYSFNTDRHNEVTDIVKKADKELYKEIIEGIVSSDKWGDCLTTLTSESNRGWCLTGAGKPGLVFYCWWAREGR
jgi:hypothetical protein